MQSNSSSIQAKPKKMYVAATQHFDILWRKTFSYYRQTQKAVIEKVISIMEEKPDFRFALQQANVLRYFVEDNPELAQKLKQHVSEGRLEIVGGLETIPDSNMPSGESLLRNLVYGRKWVKDYFGVEPIVGTMMDVFGSSGQIPQMLAKTGHEAFLAGRMPNAKLSDPGAPCIFTWKGIDGSSIKGIHMTYGRVPEKYLGGWYGWGVLEGFDQQYRDAKLTREDFIHDICGGLEALSKLQNSADGTFAPICGEEHLPRKELLEAIEQFRNKSGIGVQLARYDEFVKNADWSKADRLGGEYNVEFTGCYTTRIRLKQWNQLAEAGLFNAEYIQALKKLAGKSVENDCLLKNWQKLFVAQFHDALCGCHIDENYYQVSKAWNEILADAEIKISEAAAAYAKEQNAKPGLLVINSLPQDMNHVIRTQTSAESLLDASGKAVRCQRDGKDLVFFAEMQAGQAHEYLLNKAKSLVTTSCTLPSAGLNIGKYLVTGNDNGVCIQDKTDGRFITGKSKISAQLKVSHEKGTLWTEEFTGEYLLEKAGESRLKSVEVGPVFAKLSYAGAFSKKPSWPEFVNLKWQKNFYIYRNLDRVDVFIDVLYEGKATELKVFFECDFDSGSAQSRYEIPFGSLIRRPYGEGEYKFGQGNWPAVSWLDYSDSQMGVMLVHTGTPGCLAKDGLVSFSLLRSSTYYEEPLYPAKPEEMSFDNGHHHYEFSIIPHLADDQNWLSQARAFVYKPICVQKDFDADTESLSCGPRIDKANVVLSSFKPAEDGNGVIVRVFETLGKETVFSLGLNGRSIKAFESSMDEQVTGRGLDCDGISIGAFEIKTIRIPGK